LLDLRSFPHSAMWEAGYQLDKVRHGLPADDGKPMKTIGAGVVELRIWDEAGTFRVVYVAKFEDSFMCCTVFRRRQKRQANGI
jgi:phage-related protein